MDIFSIFMFAAILLSCIFISLGNKYKFNSKKVYVTIMGICLFLIAALRSTSVGNDSGQYARVYYALQRMSIRTIVTNYSELGYYLFAKVLSFINSNHQFLFAVIGGFYAYSISRFIYKYSKDTMASFIMLIPMMYFSFSLTGLRQTMAIAIILISIDYILKRRIIPFFLLVIIAYFFHNSAIFFIPAYFLPYKKISNKLILGFILATPIVYLLRRQFVSIVQQFIYSDYNIAQIGEEAKSWATLLIYILILVAVAFFKDSISRSDDNFPLLFSMMYIGMCLQMFVPLEPSLFRVSMYYNITSIILIPNLLTVLNNKRTRSIAYLLFFILMAVEYYNFTFYSSGVNPYNFFWG